MWLTSWHSSTSYLALTACYCLRTTTMNATKCLNYVCWTHQSEIVPEKQKSAEKSDLQIRNGNNGRLQKFREFGDDGGDHHEKYRNPSDPILSVGRKNFFPQFFIWNLTWISLAKSLLARIVFFQFLLIHPIIHSLFAGFGFNQWFDFHHNITWIDCRYWFTSFGLSTALLEISSRYSLLWRTLLRRAQKQLERIARGKKLGCWRLGKTVNPWPYERKHANPDQLHPHFLFSYFCSDGRIMLWLLTASGEVLPLMFVHMNRWAAIKEAAEPIEKWAWLTFESGLNYPH